MLLYILACTLGAGACVDDPNGIVASQGHTCSSVLQLVGGNCGMQVFGVSIRSYCPLSCGECPPTPRPTATPTTLIALPTATPTTPLLTAVPTDSPIDSPNCIDDPHGFVLSFGSRIGGTCESLLSLHQSDCQFDLAQYGAPGMTIEALCPCTCGIPTRVPTAAPVLTCDDDPTGELAHLNETCQSVLEMANGNCGFWFDGFWGLTELLKYYCPDSCHACAEIVEVCVDRNIENYIGMDCVSVVNVAHGRGRDCTMSFRELGYSQLGDDTLATACPLSCGKCSVERFTGDASWMDVADKICLWDTCVWKKYEVGKDWGWYDPTDGNCARCNNRCDNDSNCAAFECGDELGCAWWAHDTCQPNNVEVYNGLTCWKPEALTKLSERLESWHCVRGSCMKRAGERGRLWGTYPDITDCTACQKRCELDPRCEVVECSDLFCVWWAPGHCNDFDFDYATAGLTCFMLADGSVGNPREGPRKYDCEAGSCPRPDASSDCVDDPEGQIYEFGSPWGVPTCALALRHPEVEVECSDDLAVFAPQLEGIRLRDICPATCGECEAGPVLDEDWGYYFSASSCGECEAICTNSTKCGAYECSEENGLGGTNCTWWAPGMCDAEMLNATLGGETCYPDRPYDCQSGSCLGAIVSDQGVWHFASLSLIMAELKPFFGRLGLVSDCNECSEICTANIDCTVTECWALTDGSFDCNMIKRNICTAADIKHDVASQYAKDLMNIVDMTVCIGATEAPTFAPTMAPTPLGFWDMTLQAFNFENFRIYEWILIGYLGIVFLIPAAIFVRDKWFLTDKSKATRIGSFLVFFVCVYDLATDVIFVVEVYGLSDTIFAVACSSLVITAVVNTILVLSIFRSESKRIVTKKVLEESGNVEAKDIEKLRRILGRSWFKAYLKDNLIVVTLVTVLSGFQPNALKMLWCNLFGWWRFSAPISIQNEERLVGLYSIPTFLLENIPQFICQVFVLSNTEEASTMLFLITGSTAIQILLCLFRILMHVFGMGDDEGEDGWHDIRHFTFGLELDHRFAKQLNTLALKLGVNNQGVTTCTTLNDCDLRAAITTPTTEMADMTQWLPSPSFDMDETRI